MDTINLLREAVTVLAFVSFLGIAWWAYNPRRKKELDRIARSVLED